MRSARVLPPNRTAPPRSMVDGVHGIERIHARGAMIKMLDKPHLDLTTPIGRGFIAFLSALAEDERQARTAAAPTVAWGIGSCWPERYLDHILKLFILRRGKPGWPL